MGKSKNLKRKREEKVEKEPQKEESEVPPSKRFADDSKPRKEKWINKQRVLVFASRGINHRDRHLMEDLKKLMPHHKPESKMERNKTLSIVNEICEMKNCNKALMFEGRKKRDLYLWMSNIPNGPSIKFLVENVHTMGELKMTGNCLRGSRPLLSFDPTFNEKPHYTLMKEILTQIFGVPNKHPKSQPFFDHIYTFTVLDNRIWFRNFQILSEDGALAEIGPRFVLNPVKMFSGSFGGPVLWDNPNYISPARYRQEINKKANYKYVNRVQQKALNELTQPKSAYENLTPLNDIFDKTPLEKAQELKEKEENDDKPEVNLKIKKKGKLNKKKKIQSGTKGNREEEPGSILRIKKKNVQNGDVSDDGKSNEEPGSILRIKKKKSIGLGKKKTIKKSLK